MNQPWRWGLTLAVAAALVVPAAWVAHGSLAATTPVDFNRDVRPILNRSCIGCHGGVRQLGDFSVQFREDALKPARSGLRAIVPGSPRESELIRRVNLPASNGEHMPKRGVALTDAEKALLTRWIKEGAVWQDYWAYVAPVKPVEPKTQRADWVQNPVDSFVLARLEQAKREPAPRADCARLLRRVSLDLVGLPATWDDTHRFCADPSQANYLREVDRLLASPQFGERWASMWLDLARYADSIGYEDNTERVMFEYRDWVIRAFNRDLPFDEFTIEQIAGDLLPQPTREQLIATAYHRNTPTRNDEEEFRIEAVMDRVANTWEVWQGQTIGCARCHSHTYDPFRQTDFYKLMAFFNNTEDADNKGNKPQPGIPKGRAIEWPVLYDFTDQDAVHGAQLVAERDATRLELLAARDRLDVVASRNQWEEAHRQFRRDKPGFDTATYLSDMTGFDFREIDKIIVAGEGPRTPNDRSRLADFYALEVAPELATIRKRWKDLTKQILTLQPIQTPIMRERPEAARRPTHLLVRGVWRRPDPKQPMQADVPGAMPAMEDAHHDRLALAKWLVSPKNPLTARVIANRFWAELWGYGIVPSVGNFGTQGDAPSNPELLDWLAVEFESDLKWSTKALLRTMVASSTYQQSSMATPAAHEEDPRNLWLARGPRARLSAEALRDQALAVSNLLNLEQFGPPVLPVYVEPKVPMPDKDKKKPEKIIKDRASPIVEPHRRSVYLRVERKNINPTFETFDHAARFIATSQRGRTNTPLQALAVLNETEFVEAADALATQMAAASADPAEQLRWLFRTVLARDPTEAEFAALLEYDRATLASLPGGDATARRLMANVVLNLDAVLTKE